MADYIFVGVALNRFNKPVASGKWTTKAVSKKKAESNIKYRINDSMGMLPTNKLTLSGKWEELE